STACYASTRSVSFLFRSLGSYPDCHGDDDSNLLRRGRDSLEQQFHSYFHLWRSRMGACHPVSRADSTAARGGTFPLPRHLFRGTTDGGGGTIDLVPADCFDDHVPGPLFFF